MKSILLSILFTSMLLCADDTVDPSRYSASFKKYLKSFRLPLKSDSPVVKKILRHRGKAPRLPKKMRQKLKLLKEGESCLNNNQALEAYRKTFLKRQPWVKELCQKYQVYLLTPDDEWSNIKTYFYMMGKKLQRLDKMARNERKEDPEAKNPYEEFIYQYLSLLWVIDFISTHGLEEEKQQAAKHLNKIASPATSAKARPIELMELLDFPAMKRIYWPLLAAYPKLKYIRSTIQSVSYPWSRVPKLKFSPHHYSKMRYFDWVLLNKNFTFYKYGYACELYTLCVVQKMHRYAIYIHHQHPQRKKNKDHLALTKGLFSKAYPKTFEKKWTQYLKQREKMYKKE